jgi:hypothetical protein
MIVTIVDRTCYVYRQPGDPVFRSNRSCSSWSPPGWYGAESRLLHHVKLILNARGYDLIKKRMWKDGHLFGTGHTQYLPSRRVRGTPSLCVYHADHALEIAAESFNKLGRVELAVEYGLAEEGDGPQTAASMALVHDIEAAHPVYEVSWDAPSNLDSSIITSGPERYRHYRGLSDASEAQVFLLTLPGEYPRLIDRRNDERLMPITR